MKNIIIVNKEGLYFQWGRWIKDKSKANRFTLENALSKLGSNPMRHSLIIE
jgi:hypothetical protein